ncbi:phage tail tube protein [Bosea sp. FBZP-16]|uniref:phage tail tube protein n=1 Tax=Bosea sp. FBZP-16 TaxID=2065382 RepID=UPI000C31724A|nr:phage tail tube protein [Bosea sp. FBZP-16]
MAYQSGRNILVAYKPEVTFGLLPDGAAGAKVFRPNGGGLNLTKEPIRSNEIRRDGQMTRGRHGSRSVGGSYTGDLSLGSYDDWIEAAFRGTFAAALAINEATAGLTSITTTENTIVAAAGSWITAGLRVGDVIRLANHATAGNNGRNLRIVGLTASTITVAEDLIENAVADAAFTVNRPKKLLMGVQPRSFSIEEREIDIDGSEVFSGCRLGQMQLQLQPNGMAVVTFTLAGQNMQVKQGADSPYFADPAATTSIGMTSVEAMIRLGSEDVLDVTAVDLTINLNAAGMPVVGSVVTPEVFTNNALVEGSITALKKDVNRVQQFLDEAELSLHLLFTENESEPKDFCSFFIGNLTLANLQKSELGGDNGRTQQISLLIGKDERGGAYDASTVVYQTSAA